MQISDAEKSESVQSVPSFVPELHNIDQLDQDALIYQEKSEEEDDSFEFVFESQEQQAMDPQQLLSAIFPSFSYDKIVDSLEKCSYDMAASIDMLLENKKQPTQQVCRHFLAGACYRKDCWFSHQPETRICKFWLKGYCSKGSECTFSHGENVSPCTSSTTRVASTDQDHFPSLTNDSTSSGSNFRSWMRYSKVAMQPGPNGLKFESEIETLETTFEPKKKLSHLKWLNDTGHQLNSMYLQSRNEAAQLAVQRNRLFQRAADAYLSGNSALAKQLSLEANHVNTKMNEMHSKIARDIFSSRNTSSSGEEVVFDLHGLHPNEATSILSSEFKQLHAKRFKGSVVLITGTGHHSRGKAKVLPAVEEFLDQQSLKYSHGTMSDGKGGVLLVNFY